MTEAYELLRIVKMAEAFCDADPEWISLGSTLSQHRNQYQNSDQRTPDRSSKSSSRPQPPTQQHSPAAQHQQHQQQPQGPPPRHLRPENRKHPNGNQVPVTPPAHSPINVTDWQSPRTLDVIFSDPQYDPQVNDYYEGIPRVELLPAQAQNGQRDRQCRWCKHYGHFCKMPDGMYNCLRMMATLRDKAQTDPSKFNQANVPDWAAGKF